MARTPLLRALLIVGGALTIIFAGPALAQTPGPDEPPDTGPADLPEQVVVPDPPEISPQAAPEAVPEVAPDLPADPPVDPPADPGGNNGTVKIDGVEFDSHPDNQPHVGCTFQVDFYNYDEGDLDATVTFEAIPPTDGSVLLTDSVFIGEDPAGGGTDLDASATYDLGDELAGITPHPVQGWHVKLTVEAEGSQGSPVKHKVFWVTGCQTPPTTSPPTTAPPTSTPPSEVPSTQPTPSGPPTLAASPEQPTGISRASSAEGLPRTGSDLGRLIPAGLLLIGVGATAVVVARRLRISS